MSQSTDRGDASDTTTHATTQGRPGGAARTGIAIGSLAIAADRLSGALLLAVTGALFAFGQDGLAPLIGLTGGIALASFLVVPHVRRAGASGLIGFVATRYGRIARAVALIIAGIATTTLVAAELKAIAAALSVGTGIQESQGLAAALLVVVLLALAAGMPALTRVQALLLPLIAAALLLPLLWPALEAATLETALPHLTYGQKLQDISSLELRLLEAELADPVTLKAYLRPFISMNVPNTLLLIVALSLGIAVLPTLARRPADAASPDDARMFVAMALVLVVMTVLALPPLAAGARQALLADMVGQDVAAIPLWILDTARHGVIQICGATPVSQEAVTAACAALDDPPRLLRLDDITIDRDRSLFAAIVLQKLPAFMIPLLAGVVGMAAIAAAAWYLVAVRADLQGPSAPAEFASSGAPAILDEAGLGRPLTAAASRVAIVMIATLAAAVASQANADIMTLIAWGLSISAAGLAPAILLGIWWSRTTSAGATLGMLTGFSLTAYYIAGTQYFPSEFHETWSWLSAAGYGALMDYEAARDALSAADGDAGLRAALVEAARPVANWWGVRNTAAGALGMAAGLQVAILVSIVTPRPSGAARALINRIRNAPDKV
ncbi:MAG: hypothetical protein KDJ37_10730 [Hyphomicrobiaceae bacterium]|nr:hypothetical protein [Hyphomicrobiaceae bacterium]